MAEIRPITRSEAEQFLRLLCDVFSLDFKLAENIFFNEPLYDLNRKWALFERQRMLSIMTTVPLIFGWGNAIGIAGVATRPDCRGRGLAGRLLERVLAESRAQGETAAFLLAKDARLYERIGFKVLDEVVRGGVREPASDARPAVLSFDEVHAAYDAWALRDPRRLRRDDRRWRYWKWNLRICTAVDGGYACLEGDRVRELVADPAPQVWHLGPAVKWLGLRTMAAQAGLDLFDPQFEHLLMGHSAPDVPQMFLTDQF